MLYFMSLLGAKASLREPLVKMRLFPNAVAVLSGPCVREANQNQQKLQYARIFFWKEMGSVDACQNKTNVMGISVQKMAQKSQSHTGKG